MLNSWRLEYIVECFNIMENVFFSLSRNVKNQSYKKWEKYIVEFLLLHDDDFSFIIKSV